MTTIVCPAWCRHAGPDHPSDGLHVVHQSRVVDGDLSLHARTLPDGTPAPAKDEHNGDHDRVMFAYDGGDFATLGEVLDHSAAIRRLAAEAIAEADEIDRLAASAIPIVDWRECPDWCAFQGRNHGTFGEHDGKDTEAHYGTPWGPRFGINLEFVAETGEEVDRTAALHSDDSGTGQMVDVDSADLALLMLQSEQVATWLRGELVLP